MANRLAGSSSPYLLQHADNPVDWWEWSDDAFDEARRRDLPVLLSVGYAACHWCHVMAHESFEDDEVAAAVNAGFVAVKVDREERPDVDAVYMAAATALTGHGGWPMTCLLTPDGDPFFAGTYLPRAQLLALLANAGEVWADQRERVLASGRERRRAAAGAHRPAGTLAAGCRVCDTAARRLRSTYDEARGGFGGAPKFPPSMVLEFLLRHHARTGSADALAMAAAPARRWPAAGCTTSSAAASPATPSTPAGWCRTSRRCSTTTPSCCGCTPTSGARPATRSRAGSPRRPPTSCCATCAPTRVGSRPRSTPTPSSTASHEGLTYAWTPAQLVEVLGPVDGERAAALLGVTAAGTFEAGASTLQLRTDPDDPAWWAATRERLLAARAKRPQPGRDDKVVTAWNGLAVAALADAGVLLGRPDLVAPRRPRRAFVLDVHLVDGCCGAPPAAGWSARRPGCSTTTATSPRACSRCTRRRVTPGGPPRPGRCSTRPSSASSTSTASCTTPRTTHRRCSRGRRGAPTTPSRRAPRHSPVPWSRTPPSPGRHGTGTRRRRRWTPADRWPSRTRASPAGRWRRPRRSSPGPLQVAVVGEGAEASALAEVARASTSPGLVVVQGMPDAVGVPLLVGRPLVDGRAAAYVCRGFVCDAPVTSAEELRAVLARE